MGKEELKDLISDITLGVLDIFKDAAFDKKDEVAKLVIESVFTYLSGTGEASVALDLLKEVEAHLGLDLNLEDSHHKCLLDSLTSYIKDLL